MQIAEPSSSARYRTCRAILCKVQGMEINDRLRLARERRGFPSAADAAKAIGVPYGTYSGHENGTRGISRDRILEYAEKFRVSAEWLLTGHGDSSRPVIPIMGRVGAGALIEPEFEQVPPEGLDQVELPFTVPPDLIGFEVHGESMLPRYEDGDVIVVWREPRGSAEALLGEEAAVRTQHGQRYVKRLLRGPSRGTFNLESTNASSKTIEGVRLVWWSEIYLTVRAAQLRRVAQRERARQRGQTGRHIPCQYVRIAVEPQANLVASATLGFSGLVKLWGRGQ